MMRRLHLLLRGRLRAVLLLGGALLLMISGAALLVNPSGTNRTKAQGPAFIESHGQCGALAIPQRHSDSGTDAGSHEYANLELPTTRVGLLRTQAGRQLVVSSLRCAVRRPGPPLNLGAASGELPAEPHQACSRRHGCVIFIAAAQPGRGLQLALGYLALASRGRAIHWHDRRDHAVGGMQMGPAR